MSRRYNLHDENNVPESHNDVTAERGFVHDPKQALDAKTDHWPKLPETDYHHDKNSTAKQSPGPFHGDDGVSQANSAPDIHRGGTTVDSYVYPDGQHTEKSEPYQDILVKPVDVRIVEKIKEKTTVHQLVTPVGLAPGETKRILGKDSSRTRLLLSSNAQSTQTSLVDPVTLQSSTTQTTSGTGPTIDVSGYAITSLDLDLIITAVSGTTPSMTVVLQDSPDGINWVTYQTFTAQTAPGTTEIQTNNPPNHFLRVTWTITGTTPSFTFSLVAFVRPGAPLVSAVSDIVVMVQPEVTMSFAKAAANQFGFPIPGFGQQAVELLTENEIWATAAIDNVNTVYVAGYAEYARSPLHRGEYIQ